MGIKETEKKLLDEYWMLYTDWVPRDGKKLRFKKVIDKDKRLMLKWIISKAYEAGLDVANKIITYNQKRLQKNSGSIKNGKI